MAIREIIFRGKRVDNGEWVYGYYFVIKCNDTHWIDEQHGAVEVDKNTVGQFAGLTDKNGIKIFEGDIVESKTTSKGIVMYKDEYACFVVSELDIVGYEFYLPLVDCMEDLEVIGNVHEVSP